MSYTLEITIPSQPPWEIAIDCYTGLIVSQQGQPPIAVDTLRSLLSLTANLHAILHAHGWTHAEITDPPSAP